MDLDLLKSYTRLDSEHNSPPLGVNISAKLLKVKCVYLSLQGEDFEPWVTVCKLFCHCIVLQEFMKHLQV